MDTIIFKQVYKKLSQEAKIELSLVDELENADTQLKTLSSEASGHGLSEVKKAVLKADRSFTA